MIDLVVRERREAFKGGFIIPEVVYHKPTLSDIKEALKEFGMVARPRHPTVEMLDAGIEAMGDESPTAECFDIYSAMISAQESTT